MDFNLGFKLDASPITLFSFFIAWVGIVNKINGFNSRKKLVVLFFLFWIPITFYTMLPNIMFSICYFVFIVTMFAFSHVQKKLAFRFWVANIVAVVLFISTIIQASYSDYLVYRLLAFINPNADQSVQGI